MIFLVLGRKTASKSLFLVKGRRLLILGVKITNLASQCMFNTHNNCFEAVRPQIYFQLHPYFVIKETHTKKGKQVSS